MLGGKIVVAFDVDCTLITSENVPNYKVIDLYRAHRKLGHIVVIWSGGGVEYAMRWAEKLGLKPNFIWPKEETGKVDICFDDQNVDLAKVNIQIK